MSRHMTSMLPAGLFGQQALPPLPVSVHRGSRAALGRSWFVHGMLEDQHCWKALLDILDPAEALVPQFPWSAQNGSDWGRQAEGHAWLQHFAQAQPGKPQLMLAHSYGCNALLEYLLLNPAQQPAALVLLSPFYRAQREEIAWSTFRTLADGLEPLLAESITIQDTRGRYTGWLLEEMVTRVRDRLGVYGWAEFLKLFLRAPDLPLERLQCPVLVVSGEHDAYSVPATNQALAQRLPQGQHLGIAGAGHFPHITHAEQLAAGIAAFAAASFNAI